VRRGVRFVSSIAALLSLLASLAAPLAAETPRRAARGILTSPGAPTTHRVKPGDTLAKIAAHHRVTIASIVAANRLRGPKAQLRVGQRLTIPGATVALARVRRALAVVSVRRAAPPPRTLTLAVPDFSELIPHFVWPVDGQLSSKFGRRRMGWHQGIDITAELGRPVTASAPGTVVASSFEPRYGRVVRIEHLHGFLTVYAHNSENLVEAGERVTLGQVIAAVGHTGRATANHVHFEIRQAGLAYDPLSMLPSPLRLTATEETPQEDHEDVDE
jgi:murein DD-endopeptidase MepM/ murein hydrolase activator NlpD